MATLTAVIWFRWSSKLSGVLHSYTGGCDVGYQLGDQQRCILRRVPVHIDN